MMMTIGYHRKHKQMNRTKKHEILVELGQQKFRLVLQRRRRLKLELGGVH